MLLPHAWLTRHALTVAEGSIVFRIELTELEASAVSANQCGPGTSVGLYSGVGRRRDNAGDLPAFAYPFGVSYREVARFRHDGSGFTCRNRWLVDGCQRCKP
jgi:hypothetical protein